MTRVETMHENIGALETGVLIPTCNIKEQLSKMSPEEARKATRKWRKLMRRAKKEIPKDKKKTKREQIYLARKELRRIGKEKLSF